MTRRHVGLVTIAILFTTSVVKGEFNYLSFELDHVGRMANTLCCIQKNRIFTSVEFLRISCLWLALVEKALLTFGRNLWHREHSSIDWLR